MTNASIVLAPVSMLSSDFRPSLPLPHFNRHLLGAEHGDEQRRGGLTLRLGLHQQVRPRPEAVPSVLAWRCVPSVLAWRCIPSVLAWRGPSTDALHGAAPSDRVAEPNQVASA